MNRFQPEGAEALKQRAAATNGQTTSSIPVACVTPPHRDDRRAKLIPVAATNIAGAAVETIRMRPVYDLGEMEHIVAIVLCQEH